MLTSRSVAESRVTSTSPIRMVPELAISSPAMRRRVVVLPQPEGPSNVTSVPGAISNFRSRTATTSP